MKRNMYFVYALVVTVIVTIVSWADMIDSSTDSGRWRSGSGGGGGGYGYSGGGHK